MLGVGRAGGGRKAANLAVWHCRWKSLRGHPRGSAFSTNASPIAPFPGLPAGMTDAQVHAVPVWRGRFVSTTSAALRGVVGKSAATMGVEECVATVRPASGSVPPGSASRHMEVWRLSRLVALAVAARSASVRRCRGVAPNSGLLSVQTPATGIVVGTCHASRTVLARCAVQTGAGGSVANANRDWNVQKRSAVSRNAGRRSVGTMGVAVHVARVHRAMSVGPRGDASLREVVSRARHQAVEDAIANGACVLMTLTAANTVGQRRVLISARMSAEDVAQSASLTATGANVERMDAWARAGNALQANHASRASAAFANAPYWDVTFPMAAVACAVTTAIWEVGARAGSACLLVPTSALESSAALVFAGANATRARLAPGLDSPASTESASTIVVALPTMAVVQAPLASGAPMTMNWATTSCWS